MSLGRHTKIEYISYTVRPAQVILQVAGEICGTVTKDEERFRGAEESSIKAIRESKRRERRREEGERKSDTGYEETGRGINGDRTGQSHVKKEISKGDGGPVKTRA